MKSLLFARLRAFHQFIGWMQLDLLVANITISLSSDRANAPHREKPRR
jgi:hypothetical protein